MVDANAVKERTAKKSGGRPKTFSNDASHKHCKICSINIDIKSDPRICKSADCIAKNEKNQKNDKMMRIMFFVFFAAVVAPVFLSLLGYGGG
mgnify:FL=1